MTALHRSEKEEKHWKLARYNSGLSVYDDGDDGGGDYGSLGGATEPTAAEAELLAKHKTLQANNAKLTKSLIIERKYQIAQGNAPTNADPAGFGQEQLAHPVLGDKAQFSGAEENNPFADNDNNQDRQLDLKLRNEPTPAPAPAPSSIPTPRLTVGG